MSSNRPSPSAQQEAQLEQLKETKPFHEHSVSACQNPQSWVLLAGAHV